MSISIIAMSFSLLLPAIQASRESARIVVCADHLRQLGLAALSSESAHGALPSGGWGYRWYGDPDRGTGARQPGGWPFGILSFLERRDLARLGSGLDQSKKKQSAAVVNETPLPLFVCPSRRAPALYPFHANYPPYNAALATAVAKTDYAANGGDILVHSFPGPATLDMGDDPAFAWPSTAVANGVCHLRSEVRLAQVGDGTSRTYLIGEKYAIIGGNDPGDDQSMYVGYDWDSVRWTSLGWNPMPDGGTPRPEQFGSAHPEVCQFVFCDGSVHAISFSVDDRIHKRLGNRRDGELFDDASY